MVKLPDGDEYIQLRLFNDGYYVAESLGKKMNLCVNSDILQDGIWHPTNAS